MINHILFRTSSDTLKLQRLVDYIKTTGSDTGTKLEANASEYLTRVNVSIINEIGIRDQLDTFLVHEDPMPI